MSKQENSKTRYYVQWDTHARHMCRVLCSLMEHQSLVDLAICCGTNTIHAHKCVLAANSPYFREQLEKNTGTEQILITGIDFTIVKSIIEFMYCGETNILDENLKYIIAAAKFFQMRGLQSLVSDHDIHYETDSIHIPPPIFLPKKPKYPNAYRPLTNTPPSSNYNILKNPVQSDPYMHRKIKRKFVRSEAEKACAKEAAASRSALEALQRELASTSQMSSFVIEESCTETTVENFIPHSDESFIDNFNQIENVPLQMVNFNKLNNSLLASSQIMTIDKNDGVNNLISFEIPTNEPKDKLKDLLGTNIPANMEIMFKTSDGDIVNVTDDVLQNLSGGTLQYQLMDENGQMGEIREIQVQEQNYGDSRIVAPLEQNSLVDINPHVNTNNAFVPCEDLDLSNVQHTIDNNQNNPIENKELKTNDGSVPEILNSFNECSSESNNYDSSMISDISQKPEEKLVHVINSSDSLCNSDIEDKTNIASTFINTLNKKDLNNDIIFDNCSMNEFLNLGQLESNETKSNFYMRNSKNVDTDKIRDQRHQELPRWYISKDDNANPLKANEIIDLSSDSDTILSISTNNYNENKIIDVDDVIPKKSKISDIYESDPLKSETSWPLLDNIQISPRLSISAAKINHNNLYQNNLNECKEIGEENEPSFSIKFDKPRKITQNRKRKFN